MSNTPVPAASAVPAVPNDVVAGLDDFTVEDIVMPTLRIDHDKARFIDGLSNEEFPELEVVVLGLIKQRILWDADPSDDAPFCKSYDHSNGTVDPKNPNRFPWAASGFAMTDFAAADGSVAPLPCEGCALKEWGSHPKNKTPWCTEQYVLPLLMEAQGEFVAPAILTLQRTAVKPCRAYLSSFARARVPTFTVSTKLGLNAQRKGTVDYAVPTLVRGGPTDADSHGEYAEQYRMIRSMLTTPRVIEDDATPVAAPTTSATTVPAPPMEDDDEMPF